MNVKISNVYLNVKIKSLIHLTALTHNSLFMTKAFNSIIQIILLIIIIISCTILSKVISFKNYTHTNCGLFDHSIQYPYYGLFGHTI